MRTGPSDMSRAQSFLELENKVCIITGSTSGIGKAIAKELGDLGAKVVINSRSEQRAVVMADELRSDGISCLGIVPTLATDSRSDPSSNERLPILADWMCWSTMQVGPA